MQSIGKSGSGQQVTITGRKRRKGRFFGLFSPFPVKHVLTIVCGALDVFSGILELLSLYLNKYDIVDRKRMILIRLVFTLFRLFCKDYSTGNKLRFKDE